MFTSYCFSTKISVNLKQKGWQFSCHLITGKNVKEIIAEKVFPYFVLVGKFIPKRRAAQLPPNNR